MKTPSIHLPAGRFHDKIAEHLSFLEALVFYTKTTLRRTRTMQYCDTLPSEKLLYLSTVQKTMVRTTNHQFQSWSSWMVDTPRNMKMVVSEQLDNIFMAYLIVVCDLLDTLRST